MISLNPSWEARAQQSQNQAASQTAAYRETTSAWHQYDTSDSSSESKATCRYTARDTNAYTRATSLFPLPLRIHSNISRTCHLHRRLHRIRHRPPPLASHTCEPESNEPPNSPCSAAYPLWVGSEDRLPAFGHRR